MSNTFPVANPDKYVKHLESELAAKNETVKVYREQRDAALNENELLRDKMKRLKKDLRAEE